MSRLLRTFTSLNLVDISWFSAVRLNTLNSMDLRQKISVTCKVFRTKKHHNTLQPKITGFRNEVVVCFLCGRK
jgi:hypothetical protein